MTAANGAYYGTVITLNGWSIYDVNMTLKVTLFELIYLSINFYDFIIWNRLYIYIIRISMGNI